MNRKLLVIKNPPLKICLLFALIPVISLFAEVVRAEENDWEYRGSYKVVIPVPSAFDLKITSESRHNDNCSRYYRNQIDIGLRRELTDRFSVEANYVVINKRSDGDWSRERRPYLNASFVFQAFGLSVADRNRLELRVREDDELWMYRNKLTVKTRRFTSLKIQPHIANEIYYDFDADKINRNRVYVGLSFKIIGGLSLGAEYIWERRDKDACCYDSNIIRTTLKYKL